MEKTKLAPTDKNGKIVAETDKYHMKAYKGPPNTDTGPNNIWGILQLLYQISKEYGQKIL